MSHRWKIFWLLVFSTAFSSIVGATGPSSAWIEIVPVAENDSGTLVFKTLSHVNRSGAHSALGRQYGWLCVNADGLWRESLHVEITTENESSSARLQEEFESIIDLEEFSDSLSTHLEGCGSGPWRSVDPQAGRGRAQWRFDSFCVDGECRDVSLPQRSLGGFMSLDGVGTSVESTFFRHSIALFDNISGDVEYDVGALFHIENTIQDEDIGMNLYRMSGVAVWSGSFD